jgi:hypothetical protein
LFESQVSCTLPKGDIDPKLLLNFKLKVIDRLTDGSGSPTPLAAVFHHPYCNISSRKKGSTSAIETDTSSEYKQCAKRLTNSARRTRKLQQISLVQVSNKNSSTSKDAPLVFGTPQHYNRLCCWGSQNPLHHKQFGMLTVPKLPLTHGNEELNSRQSGDDPILFSSIMKISTPESFVPPTPTTPFDFSKYVFEKRTSDKSLWPPPNTKSISSRKSLAEMMSGGQVTRLLAGKGILPVVISPNPHNKSTSIRVAFGPLLDEQHQPVVPCVFYRKLYLLPAPYEESRQSSRHLVTKCLGR